MVVIVADVSGAGKKCVRRRKVGVSEPHGCLRLFELYLLRTKRNKKHIGFMLTNNGLRS